MPRKSLPLRPELIQWFADLGAPITHGEQIEKLPPSFFRGLTPAQRQKVQRILMSFYIWRYKIAPQDAAQRKKAPGSARGTVAASAGRSPTRRSSSPIAIRRAIAKLNASLVGTGYRNVEKGSPRGRRSR